jgi:hypothetical protein
MKSGSTWLHGRNVAMRAPATLLFAALIAAAPDPSAAQVGVVDGPASERRVAIIVGQSGEVSLTLRNDGADAVRVTGAAHFVHEASGAEAPATWRRIADGAPQPPGGFVLEPGKTATFQARGAFGRPGVHVVTLDARDAAGSTHRFELVADRRIEPVPAAFLLDPPRFRIGLGVFEASTGSSRVARIAGRNATTGEVIVASVRTTGLVRADGGSEVSVATASPISTDAADCIGPRAPQQDCVMDVALPAGLSPGAYRLDVAALGAGGGQSVRSVAFDVRASPLWAGGLVALGALAGALVSVWRGSGAALIARRMRIADLRSAAARLAGEAADPAILRRARRATRAARALDAAAGRGADLSASLAEQAARIETLTLLDETYRATGTLSERGAAIVAPRVAALSRALDGPDWPADEIEAAATALRAELRAAPGFAAATDRLGAALAALPPGAVEAFGDDAGFGEARDAARAALADALGPLGPADDTLAARAARLGDALRALDAATRAAQAGVRASLRTRLAALRARLPAKDSDVAAIETRLAATPDPLSVEAAARFADAISRLEAGGAEAAGAPGPQVQIPGILGANSALILDIDAGIFGPAGPASAKALARRARLMNVLTNAVVLAALGAIGVLALWTPNPAWGSAADIATALLAGLGTRLAIGGIGGPAQP